MKPVQKVVILVNSPTWTSFFKREFAKLNLSWALDIEGLLKEVAVSDGTAVVIELAADSIAHDCQQIFQAENVAKQNRFFAVGDSELEPWLPLIRAAGFSDCCLSIGHRKSISSRIGSHFQSLDNQRLSIEERIQANLPWRPVDSPV